jgi:hypothetical protein
MKDRPNLSRRLFLQSTGTLSGASYLRLAAPALIAVTEAACTAKQESAPFKVLSDLEANDFSAIAARLIPTTDTPGASEAGVIYFFDHAFAGEMSSQLQGARAGLETFNAALREANPDAEQFSELTEDDQDAFLTTQESSPFFQLAWTMTMYGFFSMSKYGGNRDNVAWHLIGFEGDHGAWQYPFGYYDAETHAEANHDE